MKKSLQLLTIFFSIIFYTKAQTSVYQSTYGATGNDLGYCIIATLDGGYAMAGNTSSFGLGGNDIMLIKLNCDANVQWSHVYGGAGTDEAIGLVQTYDSGFAIVGKTSSYGMGSFDALLIKTNDNGTLQWMKTYGGIEDDFALHVHETTDHGFIVAGATLSFGQGSYDMLFIKTNLNGDTLWTKILGGILFDSGTDAEETGDGGFIFTGRTTSFGAGSSDAFLAKASTNGDILWKHTYGGTDWDEAMKVKQIADGSFMVVGGSKSFMNGSYDAFLSNIDSSGNIIWSKIYAGEFADAVYDIIQLDDNGYIIVGETESFGVNHQKHAEIKGDNEVETLPQNYHIMGTDHSNILAIRTDAAGDTVWTKAYGGGLQDEAYSIIRTPDNGFMIAAYSKSFGTDSNEFYLIKGDVNGYSGCNEDLVSPTVITPALVVASPLPAITSGITVTAITGNSSIVSVNQSVLCFSTGINEPGPQSSSIIVFPNPVSTTATIKLPPGYYHDGKAEVTLYDVTGRQIKKCSYNSNQELLLDAKQLSAGIYFLNIELTEVKEKTKTVFNAKFVVER